ncbi:uncharacterized protein E0L32_009167 [Thyridium curvatum]|uniref:Mannose-1-phosphate guanyltransferase n=1 Tax=Thyridium curvatum TaxID=1093900 RepID=A0A507AS91_9PEZI|nr:uncharacterized protein E0L32_009167 [Thyridium curvatum]TPX09566.1 hypothetical protein E0L32_009167 [Thyridium curvatum]
MSQNKGGKSGGGAGKGKKSGKGGAAEEKGEETLQAVILADSFQSRFIPFSLEKPRCLLPLANTPLIEYTLEYLAMNGVQEVFIYCGAFTDQVESYISESPRWSPTSRTTPFSSLEFIRVSDATSVGDFLRDLDKRGLIAGDFVLVHGDLVATVPLDQILAKHKARKEANRDAIMTMVLREGGTEEHRTKSHAIQPVFVVEANTGRCLHYEEISSVDSDHYMKLDPTILESAVIDVRSDLIDCGIDICTPDVLALWSESFDFELPRKNFLHNILKDYELNGKMIHADIVDEGYAARASSLQMYEAISRDVMGRWAYPLVPDSNLVSGHSYRMVRRGVYLEKGVVLQANADIQSSMVGLRTNVGSGSKVLNSVIGRRCHIGSNVTIKDSFIWDDVTIEDNSTVCHSIVANSATIGTGCNVPEGSLISFGVHVGNGISLQAPAKLSLYTSDLSPANDDTSLLGPEGKGCAYVDSDDEDEDERDPEHLQKSFIYSLEGLDLSQSSISTFNSAVSDDEDGDEVNSQVNSLLNADANSRSRLSSFASDDSAAAKAAASASNFHNEAVHSLLDALRDDVGDFDSAKLEFMGLRLANDASNAVMRRAIAAAFARRAAELLEPEHGGLEPTKAADRAIRGKKGAAKFLGEVGVGGGVADQVEMALALQRALAGLAAGGGGGSSSSSSGRANHPLPAARAGALLSAMLQQLYSLDVLEEEGILGWWADARAVEGEGMEVVRGRCKVLVEYLEAEGDSDDDDDDDDDDEEEEDSD